MRDSVTIKDIANECGVSTATVSRALSGRGYVKDDIKIRIIDASKSMGYVANSAARSLKNASSGLIGYITSDISNQFHISVAKGIESIISAKNYNLIICSSNGNAETEKKYIQTLISRNIDALIINPTCKNNEYVSKLSHNLPVVSVNRKIECDDFHGDFVDADNKEGVYRLTRQLIGAGHRLIFFIGGSEELSNARERYEGFKKAMGEIGVDVEKDYEYKYFGNFTEQSGYDAITYMIGHFDRQPTAILSSNNGMCIGALKALNAQGFAIPEQYSITCFNSINNSELFQVQPTVADYSPVQIGQIAGRFALGRIIDNSLANREKIIMPMIVPGNGVALVNSF